MINTIIGDTAKGYKSIKKEVIWGSNDVIGATVVTPEVAIVGLYQAKEAPAEGTFKELLEDNIEVILNFNKVESLTKFIEGLEKLRANWLLDKK